MYIRVKVLFMISSLLLNFNGKSKIISAFSLSYKRIYSKYERNHNLLRSAFQPFQASSSDLYDDSDQPTESLTRGNQPNFVAKWQEKGDYYVSYSTLQSLNGQLGSYTQKTNDQKKKLLNDLTLTYFARLHNLIREEYQYEKSLGR